MEFLDGAATWFRNARIVTADRVFIGCLKVEDGRIDEIGEHDSRGAGIDFQETTCFPASSNCTPTISNRTTFRGAQ